MIDMESNAIKIYGNNNETLSVDLKDILKFLVDGHTCNWSILWLEAIGNIGQSVPDFEKKIGESANGHIMSWQDLLELSSKFDQVIEITVIRDKNLSKLRRYSNDEQMYLACEYVLELIDSSYWIIHSKNKTVLTELKNNLVGVENI
jgi:hypothetical protein